MSEFLTLCFFDDHEKYLYTVRTVNLTYNFFLPGLFHSLSFSFFFFSFFYRTKTIAVINPLKKVDTAVMTAQDSDLAGPMIFAVTLGALLMFQGKLQFGYVFGLGVFGSFGLSTYEIFILFIFTILLQ